MPAVASSAALTFSLQRATADLLPSMTSRRVFTSGMYNLLSRRNIIRYTLAGNIELRRLPIKKPSAETFLSDWQLVDSIPW